AARRPGLRWRCVDVDGEGVSLRSDKLVDELLAPGPAGVGSVVALRNGHRWLPAYEVVQLEHRAGAIRLGGGYLVVGQVGLASETVLAAFVEAGAQAQFIMANPAEIVASPAFASELHGVVVTGGGETPVATLAALDIALGGRALDFRLVLAPF